MTPRDLLLSAGYLLQLAAVERAGGRYVVVRSVEEAVRAVGGGGE